MWLLDFSACLLGEGPATPILRQPCLGRVSVSPARGDGDRHTVSWSFQAFVLWRLSLVVCCASSESQSSVAESQPLSQNRRIAVHSPSSSSGLFNSVSVGAAKPYSVPGHAPHSRCPSPHFLGQHASVFCVSNTASCQSPHTHSGALFQCGSHALWSSGF